MRRFEMKLCYVIMAYSDLHSNGCPHILEIHSTKIEAVKRKQELTNSLKNPNDTEIYYEVEEHIIFDDRFEMVL
jgi:hypothetical protein